jgi:thiamine pyrophosphokinase
MTCYLIIGNNIDLKNWSYEKDATLIGVDRGAFKAVEAGLTLDLAYGDFDSVTEKEMALIQKGSKKIKKLNPIKDITDTYGAYLEAGKADKIVILGGIQGFRVEHFLALLNIVKKDPRVEIMDASSSIKHLVAKKEPYSVSSKDGFYFSFFSIGEATLSLQNFFYPLENYVLKEGDSLCVSNRLAMLTSIGQISLSKGDLLMISSRDDHSQLL